MVALSIVEGANEGPNNQLCTFTLSGSTFSKIGQGMEAMGIRRLA